MKPFDELGERLLRAGVAPRHVRRYVAELADHLADLIAEEERAGRSKAEAAALARLGEVDELAGAMIDQRQFQSWCARAPWAVFGFAPLLALAGAYFVALFILWSGWRMFLPGADTPFVRIDGLAIFYFGVGRMLYFGAPILIGWGFGLIAARQRFRAVWPVAGMVVLAWIGCAARVRAIRPAVPGGAGQVSMGFSLGPSVEGSLLYAAVILSVTAAPYLFWRLRKDRSVRA